MTWTTQKPIEPGLYEAKFPDEPDGKAETFRVEKDNGGLRVIDGRGDHEAMSDMHPDLLWRKHKEAKP